MIAGLEGGSNGRGILVGADRASSLPVAADGASLEALRPTADVPVHPLTTSRNRRRWGTARRRSLRSPVDLVTSPPDIGHTSGSSGPRWPEGATDIIHKMWPRRGAGQRGGSRLAGRGAGGANIDQTG